jgi:hypothetical protein
MTTGYNQKTVTATVEPTEGGDKFIENSSICVYCEITVTSTITIIIYVLSRPNKAAEETCAVVTVTTCTAWATIMPCAGCDEEYVQLVSKDMIVFSCITYVDLCVGLYGAMTLSHHHYLLCNCLRIEQLSLLILPSRKKSP